MLPMNNTSNLLTSLEKCIQSFAEDEFIPKSDDFFFNEHDVVCGLISHLWKDRNFIHDFQHPFSSGRVPLVHAEHLNIDLYLLDPGTAIESVRDYAYDAGLWGKTKIMAAVQVEYCSVGEMLSECDKEIKAIC